VFGSSRVPDGSDEYRQAFELGREIARRGFALCNGGFGGIMEASARGAREAGGHTIGVTTKLFRNGVPNPYIKEVIVKETLIERMMTLVELGSAYVALKGGTGTLLELAAVWEFMNKGLINEKPIVVVGGFWDPVVGTLKDELAWEGLEQSTKYVTSVRTPHECAELLSQHLRGTP
jgi:uncharacterized protein (TIGR00730 family)